MGDCVQRGSSISKTGRQYGRGHHASKAFAVPIVDAANQRDTTTLLSRTPRRDPGTHGLGRRGRFDGL